MMGLSGILVTVEEGMLPLEDIAVGLSRIPRFVGQTVLDWTVIDHLLAGMAFEQHASWCGTAPCARNGYKRELDFALHDAHEAMTSDVPTTFKTRDLKDVQEVLDRRLYDTLGLPRLTQSESDYVHRLDGAMLLAEAKLVTPPHTYRRIVYERGGVEADYIHCVAVGEVFQRFETRAETVAGWLSRVQFLLEEVKRGH